MQVEVIKLEGLARRLNVVLPAERLTTAYNERLKEVVKNVRLPGFRPGKTPVAVIEKRFGNKVLEEVASELMQAGFQQAVADHHLTIAGPPTVKPENVKRDEELKFSVFFEAYPEVKVADFNQLSVEKWLAAVTPEDEALMLEKLRRQHAHWHTVDRKAAQHDQVVIDFEGFIDGNPFPGGSGKEFTLELGSRQMIPGFEEGLLNAKAGEERDINVTFPADYPATHLANQKAVFKIKIREVKEAHLPELDDNFATQVGIKSGGVEALKKKLHDDMETELHNKLNERLKQSVLDKLIALNPVTPPESMVESEITQLQEIARQQIATQQGWKGRDPAKIRLTREPFIAQAQKRVVLGLLINEAVKILGIKSDKNKVREKIQEMVTASGYHNPEEMMAWYYQNKRLLGEIETLVLEDQVVEKILQQAKITEKTVSYQEAFASSLQSQG